MFPLASDYSFSTHLLVQKADYIQDARYRGDLLLTKMWGAVRTAECELAHLSGHSYAETCGAKLTVKPSTHVFWRKETIVDTLTLLLKIKVSCPFVYTDTTWLYIGKCRYRFIHSKPRKTRCYWVVCFTPRLLYSWAQPAVSGAQECGWDPESIWTLWEKNISFSAKNTIPVLRASLDASENRKICTKLIDFMGLFHRCIKILTPYCGCVEGACPRNVIAC